MNNFSLLGSLTGAPGEIMHVRNRYVASDIMVYLNFVLHGQHRTRLTEVTAINKLAADLSTELVGSKPQFC